MSEIIFRSADRDAAHQRQAAEIESGRAPKATCTQNADEVIVWSEQPLPAEAEAAHACTGGAK